MAKRIRADNDGWRPVLDTSGGARTVVFFCATNGQRPYRVVRVDADEVRSQEDLDAMSRSELRRLFDRSESMNVSPS
ncbi:MAG: hypothetical protein ACODAE_09430 [Gemmatimonadota bacterium]